MPPPRDEVVDLAVGDVGLELRERRARVAAVEPADRHHRLLGGQLVAGGAVGPDRGRHPGVGVRRRCSAARSARALGVLPSSRPPALGRPQRGRRAARAAGPPGRPCACALGPAVGIEPVCGVAAVAREYAVGPASAATSAVAATTCPARRGRWPDPGEQQRGGEAERGDDVLQPRVPVAGPVEQHERQRGGAARSRRPAAPRRPASRGAARACARRWRPARRRPGPAPPCSRRGRSRP